MVFGATFGMKMEMSCVVSFFVVTLNLESFREGQKQSVTHREQPLQASRNIRETNFACSFARSSLSACTCSLERVSK